jgi:hypothetical protein
LKKRESAIMNPRSRHAPEPPKALVVDKDAYALELSRYIHLNPVKARVAETPGEPAGFPILSRIRRAG